MTQITLLAEQVAAEIRGGFLRFNQQFRENTQRAARHFVQRQWDRHQSDNVERIGLYEAAISHTTVAINDLLGVELNDHHLWRAVRVAYDALIDGEIDQELNKTFYNSLTRRFFNTKGVLADIEYVALDIAPTDRITRAVERLSYTATDNLSALFAHALADIEIGAAFAHLTICAERLAKRMLQYCELNHERVVGAEFLRTVFYRERRAYIVGRVFGERRYAPLVIALKHAEQGVLADALLTDHDDVAALFGYTRNYFHADLATVSDAVVFLHTLLPRKPIDELYTVLGRAKQGKTERYRHFFRYLEKANEQFQLADGLPGMVMSVFTLPSYPLVFKVIRDHFAPPKNIVRDEVMAKYQLVFKHDRAGRLVDAQEFRHLKFAKSDFSKTCLDDLQQSCAQSLIDDGAHLIIKHLYVERRLRPLNLFVQEADPEAVADAMRDYGQALKDLAYSGIFAGDLLLKNFGVTKSGRVIFYDYDELCFLHECRFRELPSDADDEYGPGAHHYSQPNDMFPEEFPRFLGLTPAMRQALMDAHADVFTARWWIAQQQRYASGEHIELPPYSEDVRL